MGGGIHPPALYVRGLTSQDYYSRVNESGFGISVAPKAHLTLAQMKNNFGAILQYTLFGMVFICSFPNMKNYLFESE